jgi:hypothetical protein
MGKFKRASLEGSEELFRPTRPPARDEADDAIGEIVEHQPVDHRLRTLRLAPEEIELLVEAIQFAKYPERAQGQKLTLSKHERYDALRAKLQGERG